MLAAFLPNVTAEALAGHAGVAAGLLLALLALRRLPLLFALFLWPGTLAHELTHYLAGLLLGARPVALDVWPRRVGGGRWQLGEVRFARLRWWNKAPVGLAPLALLPLAAGLFWLSLGWPSVSPAGLALSFLAVQFLVAAWPSRQDLLHVVSALLVLALIVLAIAALRVGWRSLFGAA